MEIIRLDRFVSNQTGCSRNDVKKLIKIGAVRINGSTVRASEIKVCPEQDRIEVNGEAINYRKHIYIMLNKPKGYVCSTHDNVSRTVLDLISPEILEVHKGIFPAGRLDKDTEGFVLLTDDGELAHEILSPAKHIPKYYLVRLSRPFDEKCILQFDEGILLENGEKCLPAEVCGIENDLYCAFIKLTEGKFHQIKRMFKSVENNVEYLFRTQLGGLTMHEKLRTGDYMEMLHKDVESLEKNEDFFTAKGKSVSFFSSYLINT